MGCILNDLLINKIMEMNFKIKIWTGLCLLLLSACAKDNSIVKTKTLDNIKIGGLAKDYSASRDDILAINPTISKEFTADADLAYAWYAFNQNTMFAADTLSKSKDLSVPITMLPGSYTLVFKVTDKTTGVFYKASTVLNVVNDYTTGIMVLAEQDGNAALYFLNTVSNKFIEDVYPKSNGAEPLGKSPVSVYYYPQNFSMPAEVLILCRDQRGGVFVDPNNFKKFRDLRNSFMVPWEDMGTIGVESYVSRSTGGLQDYLIVDGQLLNRAANAGELLFRPALLGNYKLSKYSFYDGSYRVGVYDNENMRFLCHNNTSGTLNPYLTGTTINIINPNNVGLKLVYGGAAAMDDYFGLFENAAKTQRYILRFGMVSFQQNFTAKEKYTISADDILNAGAFASSVAMPNYLFYSSGSKVYVYNVTSKSGGLLFDMGSGISINMMKMNGSELKVAYVNPGLPGKKGCFATYNISTVGGITATQTRKKEGFCDKVIDLTNKS
jgi:hypothetical protein